MGFVEGRAHNEISKKKLYLFRPPTCMVGSIKFCMRGSNLRELVLHYKIRELQFSGSEDVWIVICTLSLLWPLAYTWFWVLAIPINVLTMWQWQNVFWTIKMDIGNFTKNGSKYRHNSDRYTDQSTSFLWPTRTTLGDRSFTAAGPHLRNNLPLHLRDFELSPFWVSPVTENAFVRLKTAGDLL